MTYETRKPEWIPEGGGSEYASRVVGAEKREEASPAAADAGGTPPRRKTLSVEDYVEGVLAGNRTVLGRAITLVESNAPAHLEQAQEMLRRLLPQTGKSIRVGITGFPGAGKSTFIETLGTYLCDRGRRVAVLAVDPSSSRTRGSILGDKTRMEKLSRNPGAFIRPSPSGGILGGVARKSRETMLVCEAAGYDVILVETVGVGQSETTVRSMVDFFLLVLIAGAGDELQGIKRGIMELTDGLVVNKADGDNRTKALAARAEFERILHYLQPVTPGWQVVAQACSALTGEGIPEMWDAIERFREATLAVGSFADRRRSQTMDWVRSLVEEYLRTGFYRHPRVSALYPGVERAVLNGELSPTQAVRKLLRAFEGELESGC